MPALTRRAHRFILKPVRENRTEQADTALLRHFDAYFGALPMGAALVDATGKLRKANRAFHAFAQCIYESGQLKEHFTAPDAPEINSDQAWEQALLDHFGPFLGPERVQIECLLYRFQFYAQAVLDQPDGEAGQHLIFLVRQEKVRSEALAVSLRTLTPKETAVLNHLASGKRNMDIAQAMSISPFTVKTHLQNIYAKCRVSGRGELLAMLN